MKLNKFLIKLVRSLFAINIKLSRMDMNELINSLPADRCARIHKFDIIAFDKIDTIEQHFVTIKGVDLPIGDSFNEEFFQKIQY